MEHIIPNSEVGTCEEKPRAGQLHVSIMTAGCSWTVKEQLSVSRGLGRDGQPVLTTGSLGDEIIKHLRQILKFRVLKKVTMLQINK